MHDFPDTSESKHWYDIKIFPAELDDCTKEMRRDTHATAISRMFKDCGIVSCKKCHYWRGVAAREAQRAGVRHDGIRSLGRWQGGSMDHSYALDLPEAAMRALAGFSAEFRNYFVKRGQVEVPVELEHQVFPELESEMEIENAKSTPNKAKIQFLELLKYLRTVLLQDACILMEKFPACAIWNTGVFQSHVFFNFKNDMLTAMETIEEPRSLAMHDVLPEAFDILLGEMAQVKSKLAVVEQKLDKASEKTKRRRFCITEYTDGEPENTTTPPSVPAINPSYTMSRTVSSVGGLFEEWTSGIHGNPSIMYLEETMGTKWRASSKDKMFFIRRRKVITLLEEYSSRKGVPIEDAVTILENFRKENSKTLDWISKNIPYIKQYFTL